MRIHTVQLNLGDLMGGTSRMDGTEFGAYALLFLNCYQDSTHTLPADDEEIRIIARVSPKVWRRIRDKVMKKFVRTADGWRHKRVEEEIAKMLRKSSKNSANALERWKTPNANALPEGEEVASGSHCESDATQNPKSKTKKPSSYNDPEFEKFWFAWPHERRCEKPKAYREWKEAKRKCPPERLLEYEARYLDGKQAKEGFAPYPARWLKYERWLEVMDAKDGLGKIDVTMDDVNGDSEFLGILQQLRGTHGEAIFRSWFSHLRVGVRSEDELVLTAPTRFMAEWITQHYSEEIRRVVKETWPTVSAMKVKISNQKGES